MSNITIERAGTTVVWDMRDRDHGVYTQANFRVFKHSIAGEEREGFYVSFNGEFAGLDHCWTHPGDDIVGFLRSISFDYAMGKLIDNGKSSLEDYQSMNDDYFEWLEETFEDDEDDFARELRWEIEMYSDNNNFLASSTADHIVEMATGGVIADKADEYYEEYAKYNPKTKYKHTYVYFWDKFWPVFVDAVEEYMKGRDK